MGVTVMKKRTKEKKICFISIYSKIGDNHVIRKQSDQWHYQHDLDELCNPGYYLSNRSEITILQMSDSG